MDIFWTLLLKPPQPFIGLFLSFGLPVVSLENNIGYNPLQMQTLLSSMSLDSVHVLLHVDPS